jgi:hypothetical protein
VEVSDVKGEKHQLKTTLLDDFLIAEEGRLHPFDQRALYIDFKERMRQQGIRPGMDEFRRALKNDRYFNALQAKYGYAITCHKSQGGEWENAFVDFQVFMGKLSKGFFRWAYTAITRSSKQLLCMDAPQYNALSQFVVQNIESLSGVIKGAVYVPQLKDNSLYFVQYRMQRLSNLCTAQAVTVSFKTYNYQLETTLQKDNNSAVVQLFYGNNGFTRTNWHSCTDNEFKGFLENLLLESMMPERVPFEPKFPFQNDLHLFLLEILQEENISLMNVVQKEWSDQYFLQTGAECALVEFFYNAKHMYSVAMPKSTAGINDGKLQSLVERLRGA